MMRLFWPLMYTMSCALVAFFFAAGAFYWDWEIGAKAAAGGAVFGFLGYLLIRYGPKRPDPTEIWRIREQIQLNRVDVAVGHGRYWRGRTTAAEALLERTLAYLGHKPFDSITVCELYDDIHKHFAGVEEANRGREENG